MMVVEEHRKKIETTKLVNRLTNHALGKLKKPMDASQVSAALGVLKKALPDMKETVVDATVDGSVTINLMDPTLRDDN